MSTTSVSRPHSESVGIPPGIRKSSYDTTCAVPLKLGKAAKAFGSRSWLRSPGGDPRLEPFLKVIADVCGMEPFVTGTDCPTVNGAPTNGVTLERAETLTSATRAAADAASAKVGTWNGSASARVVMPVVNLRRNQIRRPWLSLQTKTDVVFFWTSGDSPNSTGLVASFTV